MRRSGAATLRPSSPASNEIQEAIRAGKRAIRDERRRRHEARQAASIIRDRRIAAAFERYRSESRKIWADWRQAA